MPQPLRQHVLEEAPDELHAVQFRRLPLAAVAIVLVPEQHLVAFDRDQAAVADRHAIGVPGQIRDRLVRRVQVLRPRQLAQNAILLDAQQVPVAATILLAEPAEDVAHFQRGTGPWPRSGATLPGTNNSAPVRAIGACSHFMPDSI